MKSSTFKYFVKVWIHMPIAFFSKVKNKDEAKYHNMGTFITDFIKLVCTKTAAKPFYDAKQGNFELT